MFIVTLDYYFSLALMGLNATLMTCSCRMGQVNLKTTGAHLSILNACSHWGFSRRAVPTPAGLWSKALCPPIFKCPLEQHAVEGGYGVFTHSDSLLVIGVDRLGGGVGCLVGVWDTGPPWYCRVRDSLLVSFPRNKSNISRVLGLFPPLGAGVPEPGV